MKLEADLVVLNADVITMDPSLPTATAIAVKNYKFLAVGSDDEMEEIIPHAKRVVDMGGKTILPGFVDGHTHITYDGIRSRYVDLSGVGSIEELKNTLREALTRHRPSAWLRGYGWDESNWPEKRYVTAADLDEVSTEQPILIDRVDAHLASANSLGLRMLGLPLDHEGVLKDNSGRPTGVLRDVPQLHRKVEPTPEDILDGVKAGTRIANIHGITTAVDNIPPGYLRYIRMCEVSNSLSARLVVNIREEHLIYMTRLGLTSGMGSPMLKIGGVKIFTDGSIGAHTAAVSVPYRDDPTNIGRLLVDPKKLKKTIRMAVQAGIQTVIHAIGDRAIEMVISTFESLSERERAVLRTQRHRIEHAEMISEEQIRRAVALGLILSMQPNFVGMWQLRDGLYSQRFEEERVDAMNMFRVALDNGARVCFGSDGMPYGPLYGIWAAVTHPNPRVRLTVEESIRCYTLESAYASFGETTVGSIQVGKRADFVVLSDNILGASPASIRDIRVEATFVGGIEEFSIARNRGI